MSHEFSKTSSNFIHLPSTPAPSCAMFGGRKGKGKGKAQAAPKPSSWAIQGGAAEKIIVAEPPNKRRKGGSAVLGGKSEDIDSDIIC